MCNCFSADTAVDLHGAVDTGRKSWKRKSRGDDVEARFAMADVPPASCQGPPSSAVNTGGSEGGVSAPAVGGAPRHACDVCSKTFSARRSMIHHRRMIHESGRLKKKQDAATAAAEKTAMVSGTADISDRYDGWVWWDL